MFAKKLCHWLFNKFQITLPYLHSVVDLWEIIVNYDFSPQLANIWIYHLFLSFLSDLDDREYVAFWRCSRVLSLGHDWLFRSCTFLYTGYVGYGRDPEILQSLGVPHIYILNWRPPDFGWCKVNIDGLSKGNPGLSACEGVFRDNIGTFLGSFGISPGVNTACFAEGIILAVELSDCWWKLWPKAESILVIHLLSNHSLCKELWKYSIRKYLNHWVQGSLYTNLLELTKSSLIKASNSQII